MVKKEKAVELTDEQKEKVFEEVKSKFSNISVFCNDEVMHLFSKSSKFNIYEQVLALSVLKGQLELTIVSTIEANHFSPEKIEALNLAQRLFLNAAKEVPFNVKALKEKRVDVS